MSFPKIRDPNSTVTPHDQKPSRGSQGLQVSQVTQGQGRGASSQSGSRPMRDGDDSGEEPQMKGSSNAYEAEEPGHPPSTGPPVPDKPTTKYKETQDGHTPKRQEPRRGSRLVKTKAIDELAQNMKGPPQYGTAYHRSEPGRAADLGAQFSGALLEMDIVQQGQQTQHIQQHLPHSPNIRDSNPTSILYDGRPSQASQVAQGGWGQGWGSSNRSGSRHLQGGGDPREERQLKRSNSDPEAEPVTKYKVEIVHQGQQMQHVQPQQPEAREAQDYGCGMDNVIRSRIPAGGSSPPGDKITEDLQKAVADIEYLRMKKKEAQEEYLGLRHAHYNVTLERDRLEGANYHLQCELANVQRQIEESKPLLGIRRQQVADALAQVYLTKADYLSTTDVADKVRILNGEIFQAASFLADSPVHRRDLSFRYVRSCRDPSMLIMLMRYQAQHIPLVHPLIVQAVLSIFLVDMFASKLRLWHPGGVAVKRGRGWWNTENWKAEIIQKLGIPLIFTAWNAPTGQHAFEKKLATIIKAVEDLQIALCQRSTFAYFEIDSVMPGSIFEEWMEDSYGLQSGRKHALNEVVVGTTGFGLKQVITVKEPPAPTQNSSTLSVPQVFSYTGSRGRERFLFVLPPKVVRESTLRETLEPPPSNATRKETPAHLDGKEDVSYTCGRDV